MSAVAVIGSGYVGLSTGACLAHLGHTVVCADVVPDKVERLNRGEIPIVELGLEEMVRHGLDSGRLSFVLGAANAVRDAEFVYLCLPTPAGADGSPDMSYVKAAAAEIGPALAPGAIVINKSTVPVGATRIVEEVLQRGDVNVVSNPEFLREGTAMHDFLHPDRIVIGASNEDAAERVASLLDGLDAPVHIVNPASAELIKYASNSFLAAKISFINAIANVCEAVGADIDDVVLAMGADKRIGAEFLKPGPGWGGSCFPKDTLGLVSIAGEAGYDFSLLDAVISANEEQYIRIADKIESYANGDLANKTVALLGLTFKANTDDLRESPALHIAKILQQRGAAVRAYDPTVSKDFDGIAVYEDAYSASTDADVIAVTTEWDEFRSLDFQLLAKVARQARLVDSRNLLDPATPQEAGFLYTGIGRSSSDNRVVDLRIWDEEELVS